MRNRKENQIDLALIRHGMTASNSEKRYLGRTNEPLSEEGRRLLLLRKEQGCYPAASFLFSGPMTRCLQTGRLLYPEKTPLLIPEWTEMDFGEFEGKNYRELSGDARYQAWIDSGGLLPFPGGESREAFLLRCRKGLEQLGGMVFTLELPPIRVASADGRGYQVQHMEQIIAQNVERDPRGG